MEDNDKSIEERVHQQLIYKDNRIIDLNNVILDKERQILDLQERVREQGEVANVKTQAMRIVQQKFGDLHKERRDMATETDSSLTPSTSYSSSFASSSATSSSRSERRARSSSPGHVIAARKNVTSGTFSPPPTDPPIDKESKFGLGLPDIDGIQSRKYKKRVTFDLPPAARTSQSGSTDDLESALNEENSFLRKQVEDLNVAVEKMKEQYEAEIAKYAKEAKTSGLKARVVATARIKELEESLEVLSNTYNNETDRLREEVNTLRNSRDWEIEQNGQLREQVSHLKEKTHKLTEELDVSEQNKRRLDNETEEAKKQMELMIDDLLQAENIIIYHENQKDAIFEDIDRLKDAILAQDRFIEILEADIVIYEQHIGLLRESLGASKIDHRALIRSKAFETKLVALEKEKELIHKKSSEEKLKTKALDKKCQVLVEQNEQLMSKLCELEMNNSVYDELKGKSQNFEEQIRQISAALESERDVSQKLREAKEAIERELQQKITASAKEEQSSSAKLLEYERLQKSEKKVDEMTEELEDIQQRLEEALREIEELRAANFDLQMNYGIAEKKAERLGTSSGEAERKLKELEEQMEEKDEELKQTNWDCEQLLQQNESLRVEIESSRFGLQEAQEVKKQLNELKEELNRQHELSRQQYEESIRVLREEEASEISRKTSMEIQQQEYITAFEEKVEKLQKELAEAKEVIESDKVEKKKLKQAVKQLRDKAEHQQQPQPQQFNEPPPITTASASAPVPVPVEEVVQVVTTTNVQSAAPIAPDAHELVLEKDAEIEKLRKMIETLKMETSLSGELNVELGMAMLELEEQNDLLRHDKDENAREEETSKMELRLHEMMVEEMSKQIEGLEAKLEELNAENGQDQQVHLNKIQELERELSAKNAEVAHFKLELEKAVHEIGHIEGVRKDEMIGMQKAHYDEIRRLSIQIEDCRREIADLEVRLEESEEQKKVLEEEMEKRAAEQSTSQETVILRSEPVLEAEAAQGIEAETPRENESTTSMDSNLAEENMMLRECINESATVQDDIARDMNKLIELKDELEIAVEALKGEIWSLNGQLKASVLDREGLEDKVAELDCAVEREKKRAITLDVELQEQVDLTDRALRRAAEAENESNRRLAECLDMEGRREELEKAYASLTDYYNQLQAAYNDLYAQMAQRSAVSEEPSTSTAVPLQHGEPENNIAPNFNSTQIDILVNNMLSTLEIIQDVSATPNTQLSLENALTKVKSLVSEVAELTAALNEQRQISDALQMRLDAMEAEAGTSATTRERVEQLEGEVEWKEVECEGLKRRVKELEKALDAIAERANESEAATVSRLSTELAILAAKLTTRQADVDSLFRTNAELSHTNVELQNDIDEMEEEKVKFVERIQELEQQVEQLKVQLEDAASSNQPQITHEPEEQSDWGWGESESQRSSAPPPENTEQNSDSDARLKDEVDRLRSSEKSLEEQVSLLKSQLVEVQTKMEEVRQRTEEVERLKEVEKILNNRIMALEDVNMELEERLQEAEEELMEKKEEKPTTDEPDSVSKPSSSENWGWGEEEDATPEPIADDNDKTLMEEVERLTNVEKMLNSRILALEDQNLELQERLQEAEETLGEEREEKGKAKEVSSAVAENTDENWGWGEESEPRTATDNSQNSELNDEVERLKDVEKILNNRILALEDVNSELQEKLQEAVELLVEGEKAEMENKQKEEKKKSDDNWGWGEEGEENGKSQEKSEKESQNEETIAEIERLKTVEVELKGKIELLENEQTKLKEFLKTAENALSEEQDRSDELEQKLEEALATVVESKPVQTAKADKENEESWGWGEDDVELKDTNNEEIERLLEVQKSLNEKVEKLEKERSTLEEKLSEARQTIEEGKDLAETVGGKLKNKIVELEQALIELEESTGQNDEIILKLRREIEGLEKQLEESNKNVQKLSEELRLKNDEIASLKVKQVELEEELAAKNAKEDGWNDDGWGEEDEKLKESERDEMQRTLEEEIQKRDGMIARLGEELSAVQDELLKINEAPPKVDDDMKEKLDSANSELESIRATLESVMEQNGLLKDSEARLIDHADEYATQMESYKNKCGVLMGKIAELEKKVEEYELKMKNDAKSSDELVTLRRQLQMLENEVRMKTGIITNREVVIAQLEQQITEHTEMIEELHEKLRICEKNRKTAMTELQRRRAAVSGTSTAEASASRPSSRMSTSSRVSVSSQRPRGFTPEPMAFPLQSIGSAFDVVLPQGPLEPVRRRHK